MNDYHDYVIKDGQFIGKFEEMYQNCDDPWHASQEDYDASMCSVATKRLIQSLWPSTLVSLGSGTGRHLNWLGQSANGVELSETAALKAALDYPHLNFICDNILDFLQHAPAYDIYLFREVLWYLLPNWQAICDALSTRHGAMVIIELSFYDDQHYGTDSFNGPDEFLRKYPFTVQKIVREHTTAAQKEGRVMIAGRVK